MAKKQESQGTTPTILVFWLVLIGFFILMTGIFRMTLWLFDFPQGSELIVPWVINIGILFILVCILNRSRFGSMKMSFNKNRSKSKVILYYLGISFIFGIFMALYPLLFEEILDFHFHVHELVGNLIGAMAVGGFLAWRTIKQQSQPQHDSK